MQTSSLNVVVAFIQPFQLGRVVDAVRTIPNFPGMSVSDVRGFGSHAAHRPRAGERGEVYPFHECLRIEIFCRAADVATIVETIRKAAYTGHAGDGKIFAGPLTLAVRIRTGESGEEAISERGKPRPGRGEGDVR